MSLLSTDIAKVKRLSLREVKLPAPDQPRPKQVPEETPYTQEEEIYSRMIAINPLLGSLVDLLDLHSQTTGKRLRNGLKRRRNDGEESGSANGETTIKRPEIAPKAITLTDIAQQVLQGEKSYTREEVIARLQDEKQIDRIRAERGFNMMLQEGVIEQTINQDLYYLGGSTPF